MPRLHNFIYECQSSITNYLALTDNWAALQQEFATFSTNGITIQDADVADTGLTAAQFMAGLTAMQQVVDYAHVLARAAALYRLKR